MPRLWNDTIEAHRTAVREALLDAVTAVLSEAGPAGVTLAQVAARAGIARATVYKYFPDVESLLDAWHDRHVDAQLAHLAATGGRHDTPQARLAAVLTEYAVHTRGQPDGESVARLHRRPHGPQRLAEFVTVLITDGVRSGVLRDDVPPAELTGYVLHALGAARALPSDAAVRRLVDVVLAGVAPPR